MLSRWIFNRSIGSSFGDVAVVAFLIVQACDGVLTYIGVVSLGAHMEGNPLVLSLMTTFGMGAGLTGAKLTAAFLGIALHLTGVHRLVAVLTAVYLAAAIIPWTALLLLAA
ncbi:MAG TPA: hypothetical protein VK911_04395 [Vicinamibacterales bacterium]|nr:hypothetical protein [Vicinamibacterales bacterium]